MSNNNVFIGASCNHRQLINQIIASYLMDKQPIMIHGGPGLGKSDCVRQAALEISELIGDENFDVVDLRLLLLEPSDLRGLPYVNTKDECHWAIAPFLPKDPDSKGILFLDELPAASQQLMKAAFQLVLDREIGEYRLPDGWLVIGAGNRISDRGGVNVMPTPLKNRFEHLELNENTIFDSWKEYAYSSGINDAVLAFLQFRSKALYAFSTDHNAFPTPRTWKMVSDKLNNIKKFKIPNYDGDLDKLRNEVMTKSIEGLVGPGISSEFMTFVALKDKLPTKESILAGMRFASKEISVIWAVTTMLASHFYMKWQNKQAFNDKEVLNTMNFINNIEAGDELKAGALRELAMQGKLNTYLLSSRSSKEVKEAYGKLYSNLKQYMH